ncbi:metal ABC transporter solute-binding protein, Zn/Mn family [Amycolatopsis cihanbeyliensis]|uniref:Zinc/manganese transport system substrate-binding protein n=1 Tax=Amycolatopsis cihanbeyliensis TaxID=1128664 RepID=A0A542DN78_AMYCI|nr:zinc ABC transporter substrate-binding protein [Amycolatopsis cihanbeyliensis]TQJ04540.1 zinc/manganese transport system substrate-binding protein [Amycolatopsis cihanbeyliensis]
MTIRRTGRLLGATSAIAALVLGLSGCGGGTDSAESGKIAVVASTNVWASVVTAVGGEHVSVTSVIDDPAADPHAYQATAEDAADVQDADLVLYNGGGYDEFFTQMAGQAPDVRELVAFDISGKAGAEEHGEEHSEEHGEERGEEHAEHEEPGEHQDHGDEHGHAGVNEHVWYDLATVGKVADQVATQLGELRPEQQATFTGNAAAFHAELDTLSGQVESLATEQPGAEVLATAPVADYLLEAAGATDVTPEDFLEAVESETDVPVAAQERMNRLVSGGTVRAVVHNVQTESPATERVVAAAGEAGVPVVDVTETLPEGQKGYIAWMGEQVSALSAALGTP